MDHIFFQGICTALVTPFQEGSVNISMLHRLLDRQLAAHIPAIVICGTTGESPTLTDKEKRLLFREAKQYVGEKALIIAGTGSNCTQHAAELSCAAREDGADGLLVVTPYYNKATDSGLYAHFSTIARAAELPLILYNVPSRTGVDLPASVCEALAGIPNIVGIKEASPDLKKLAHLRAACPAPFGIWSGNDDLLLPAMSLGGDGLISVASNLIPRRMQRIYSLAAQSDRIAAAKQFLSLIPLLDALFREVNPIPIKAAMKLSGLDCGSCRLPLTELRAENLKSLQALLNAPSFRDTENS